MISMAAFVFVASVSAGIELGLTLFVLGVAARMGAAELGALTPLGSGELLTASVVFWGLETALRVRSIPTLAAWHAAQLLARPLAAALLCTELVSAGGLGATIAAVLVGGLAATIAHAGSVGWMTVLHLARTPVRTRLVGAAAQQTGVIALLVLSLDHPEAAALLVLLLAALTPRLQLASISGLTFGSLLLWSGLRTLFSRGRWRGPSLPGMPPDSVVGLRFSTRPWGLLAGWLQVSEGQMHFQSWGRAPTPLTWGEELTVVRSAWGARLHLDADTVVFLPDSGILDHPVEQFLGSTTAL